MDKGHFICEILLDKSYLAQLVTFINLYMTTLYQISVSKPNALVLGCPHRLRVPDQSV